MNDQGSLGSPSTSNSSNSNSSMSGMPMMNHSNGNNMNNMTMMSNNSLGRREPMLPMSHHNSGPMPPSYGAYNPRGINTAGVEFQLSNIDREIRGLQQQQEQMEQMGGGMRSLTPDGLMNHSPRSLFTPPQMQQFKDQVRRYRMFLMWNHAAATTPPPSTPSPTITPPMVVPSEPRLPARGRGSRGPRGSRGTPRTRTNRPRAPKPSATAAAPPPQLPPPYVRYPTPYQQQMRYPRHMGVGRPPYNRGPPGPGYMQNDMLEGVHDGMNTNSNSHPHPHSHPHSMQNQNPEQQHNDDGLMRSINSPNCSFCASFIGDGMGISLQSCFHTFCRPCLVGSIEQCEAPQIPCPMHQECRAYLQDAEIKAVVSDEVFQAYLSRSLTLGMKSDNTLSQCYGQDCPGVCAIDDGLKSFYCPACNKLNCLTCETTHETPCESSKKRPGGPDESYAYDIAMKRSRIETAGEAELRKDFETNWEQMCAKFNPESENNCNTNSSDPTTGSD